MKLELRWCTLVDCGCSMGPPRLPIDRFRITVLAMNLLLLSFHAQADVRLSYPPYPPLFRSDSVFDCTGWSELNVADQYCRISQDGSYLELLPISSAGAATFNTSARLMYNKPVRFYDSSTGQVASFSTFFTFSVVKVATATALGSGMTFLIAPETTTPSKSIGGDLGLFDSNTTTGDPIDGRLSQIVAVEIDTYERGNFDTQDAPHLGLDLNSLRSANATYMWNDSELAGQRVAVWIDYFAANQFLEIRLMNVTQEVAVTRENGVVWLTYSGLNLSAYVNEYSYVGFSAASGSDADVRGELNSIFEWTFSTTGVVDEGSDESGGSSLGLVIGVAAGLAGAVVVLAGGAFFVWRRWKKAKSLGPIKTSKASFSKAGLQILGFSGLDGPREFKHHELKAATSNFSDESVIGEGGFGKVHVGILADKSLVAVKRVAEDSRQGEREFLAEVTTIGKLRHKNLVPLKGWCRNNDELLLVYEYMPNKSLYDHLFKSMDSNTKDEPNTGMKEPLTVSLQVDVLPWDQRYNIIQGVASALHYLHSEWEEQTLIHRDVKSSNVMLDASWNARLGDFGLARVVKKDKSAATVTHAAGTRGYLAPETMYSDKVSAESDIFSFGVLALEVVSGRKPIEWLRPAEEKFLVNWVWALEQEGRLVEAADPQLRGEYDVAQVITVLKVGLLCCMDDPTQRPSMRQVLQYLMSGIVNSATLTLSRPPVDYTMGAVSLRGNTSSTGETISTRTGLSGVSRFSGNTASTVG